MLGDEEEEMVGSDELDDQVVKDDRVMDDDLDEGVEEPAPVYPAPRPVRLPSLPVEPTLSRTGETLWGPPEPKPEPEPEPEPKPEQPASALDDLFEVPDEDDNDMYVDDLIAVDEEGDLSDLTRVTEEDIMGSPPRPRPSPVRYRRTGRRYIPPTSMGGVG